MKFLADMGVSMTTVDWLKKQSFDTIHVRELDMKQAPDSEILQLGKNQGRVILTFDLDFGDLMAASGYILPSIIIFRLKNAKPEFINIRLHKVLSHSIQMLEKGAIIIIDDKKHRIRMLPINS